MIIVTGAGGRLGGAVVDALLERTDSSAVGVSTTRPDELSALADRGVRVRRGDYDDPESLASAFEGADRVLVVSAPRHGTAALDAHRVAIEAARTAGVGRVVYTSHVGSDALSPFPPAVTHATTETMLRDSGLPFTAVRNGFYADTPLRLLRTAAESGVLRVPVDAPVSWTFHRDLAPGIASLLLDDSLAEQVVTLTSERAADLAELAATASAVLGRPIRHETVGDDEYVAGLVAAGVPEFGAAMLLGIFRASRQRRLGIVDPALGELLGRPTTTLEEALAGEDAQAGPGLART
ncbi:NAD(P)H-binding protein [Rathayibacter oskolensis]|uniref:NmrA family NAD(P)-binding protein n=1 Tax=Rathayibacter oskolensis TaxID=1891671 RepID=UPI00265DB0C6|nr:NAD(P)H-binding protein [Rathayibacter oskolensis]WKK72173.1 NAD(P)H-binding protein [Rathayibacter oskolensis]